MGKAKLLLAAALVLAVSPAVCHAEYYRYKDAKGVVHFTENPDEIPASQRPSSTRYTEPDDSLTPEQQAERAKQKEAEEAQNKAQRKQKEAAKRNAQSQKAQEGARQNEVRSVAAQSTQMDSEKAQLEAEYKSIQKEMGEIAKLKKSTKDRAMANVLEARAKDVKRRMDAYNKKLKDFEQRANSLQQRFDTLVQPAQ